MTTAPATSPLESFQHGRDNFLAVVLDVVSGLETSVLEFQHQHEGNARAAGAELAETLRAKVQLENQLGEQALELEASRNHVCAAPAVDDAFTGEGTEGSVPVTAPAAADNSGSEEAERTISELRAGLEAEQRVSAGLRAELEAEKSVSAGLRGEIDKLDGTLDDVESKLRSATEAHSRYVSETQETFDQRLSAGIRAAGTGVRGEAIRIIEAIAADNPALAEAADLFTVAFPAEAAAEDTIPAAVIVSAPAPAGDVLADLPAPELVEAPAAPQPATEPALEPEWDQMVTAPAPTAEDFYNALPAPEPEAAPAPMTQVLLPAPDLSEDAILDPNFFDNPEPLEAPVGEPVQAPAPAENQAEAPKPGYGLFGRKKEAQNA
jgi:hypothetical protein